MGEPRQRPPYPIERGIDGCPTCINNVETLANVPVIINSGAERVRQGRRARQHRHQDLLAWSARSATPASSRCRWGSRSARWCTTSAAVPPGEAKIKAVQTGGPSGGCIPAEQVRPADRLRQPRRGRVDHGLGRHDRHGREHLHGGRRQVLHGLPQGRVVRQVLHLPQGHPADARDPRGHHRGPGHPGAAGPARGARRRWSRTPPCAASASRPPTRCSAPCATSATSTSGTSSTSAATPSSARSWWERRARRPVRSAPRRGATSPTSPAASTRRPTGSFARPIPSHRCAPAPATTRARRGAAPAPAAATRSPSARSSVSSPIASTRRSTQPRSQQWDDGEPPRVAVVGAGPAGLTAAHYLSLKGYQVTVFEAETEPGGMLYCAIPAYRLPRETINSGDRRAARRQHHRRCATPLSAATSPSTVCSRTASARCCWPSARTRADPSGSTTRTSRASTRRSSFSRHSTCAASSSPRDGSGSSAAATRPSTPPGPPCANATSTVSPSSTAGPATRCRLSRRRSRRRIEEGVSSRPWSRPTKIKTTSGLFSHLECVRNRLGRAGCQRPSPAGANRRQRAVIELDTLIVAISEDSGVDCITPARSGGIEVTDWNTVKTDANTLLTSRPGVFAAGDVVTGPNTIIEAIAAGKKAAVMIDHFVRGEALVQPVTSLMPTVYRRAGRDRGRGIARQPHRDATRFGRVAQTELRRGRGRAVGAGGDPGGAPLPALRPRVHRARRRRTPRWLEASRMITLKINGIEVSVDRGTTLLEAAQFLGLPDTDLVPHGRSDALWRVPAVRRRGRRPHRARSWSPHAPTRPRRGLRCGLRRRG